MTDQTREKALKALSEILRPEFINRVDEVICFNRLTEENFRGIAKIMLGELRDTIAERGMTITWDESVVDYLVKKSYSVTYGARNLRRTIQKDIENPIAERIIDSFVEPISKIAVTAEGDEIKLKTE